MAVRLSEDQLAVLAKAVVMEGIPNSEICGLLNDLHASLRCYQAGSRIRKMGDKLDFYPILLEGEVQASLLQGGENRTIATFSAGDSFAEAVPETIFYCPVDIWIVKDAAVLCIPAEELSASSNPWAQCLHGNLAREIPKKISVLSRSLIVLGEPRLGDRILAYLRTLPQEQKGCVVVPLSRKEWANYLRVSDKSLIRELRSLQEEGIIEVDGRMIRLLDT